MIKFLMQDAGAAGGAGAAGAANTGTPPPSAGQAAGGQGNTPPAGGAPQDWTTGFSDDDKGYVTNKGFKDPGTLLSSYRNLEKAIGVPKERLLKLPENLSDAQAMNEIYARLGKPEKAEDYGLNLKEADESFSKWAPQAFHKANLTKAQAEIIAAEMMAESKNLAKTVNDAQIAKNAAEEGELKKKWGAAFEQNVNIARRAARDFKLDGEVVDKLENAMGYSKVMEFLHAVGSQLGEGAFHSGDGQSTGNALTPDAAKAKITAARQDPDFVKRYTAGDTKAREDMRRWHQQANPDA